jgi:hypothetical protein
MKKAKLLLSTLAAMLIVFAVNAQPIYFQISDVMYANADTELQFNVQTHTDVNATYFRDFQLFFEYSGGAFGTNIFANGNVVVTPIGIMIADPTNILAPLYELVNPGADNGPTTFAVLTATTYPGALGGAALTIPAFGVFPYNHETPLTYVDWLQINITILDNVGFTPDIYLRQDKMDGGQYYTGTADATPIKYDDPSFYENDVITSWPGGVCEYTWDGGGDGTSWEDPMNWDPDGIPAMDCAVTIPDGAGTKGLITIGSAAVTGVLTVGSGVDLEILPAASLTTWGLFTNNGNLWVRDGGAFLDWVGSAGPGNITVERFLPMMPSGTNAGWHLVSAPLNNETTANWASYWVKAWMETANMYIDIDPCGGDAVAGNCCPPSLFSVPLVPGLGFAVKKFDLYACGISIPGCATQPTQDELIEFTGTMANLNLGGSMPFTASNVGVPSPLFDNWNLLGNPFTASIDIEMVTFDPALAPTANYYNEASQSYVWYTKGFGGVGSQYVPPTQGAFFLAGGPGVQTLTGAERTVAGAAMFYNDQANTLKLEASNDAVGTVDHAWVTFNEEATAGFDWTLDAKKLLAKNEMTPQIYTVSNNENFAANVMPAANAVPLNFETMVDGSFTITMTDTDFENVYLADNNTGVIHDFSANSEYHFNAFADDNADRFTIFFKLSDNMENGASAWAYNDNIYVHVTNPGAEVVIYNVIGQEVYRGLATETISTIQMNVSDNYIVKVFTAEGVMTQKVNVN